MDVGWPKNHHRHKVLFTRDFSFEDNSNLSFSAQRSHAEMSEATLSPSPITFRGPPPSTFASISRYNPSAPGNNDLFFERRRTSHPHNSQVHPFQAASESMPQRSQSQQRPHLEHRASQTLIDLTEDVEEIVPIVPRNRASSHRLQPPQLGRSDAQGLADVIDLTEDDVEIQITGARNRELPLPRPDVARPRPYAHAARHESPDLFVPANQPPPLRNADYAPGAYGYAVVGGASRHGFHFHQILHGGDGGPGDVLAQIIGHAHAQPMPQMDYRHAAFADRKPDHVPPEPAKPGFTRSPTENDTVICPGCEEELVYDRNLEEPMVKKGNKPPTRKEREEHPFWVIKECGHVSPHSFFSIFS
jgi:hypothetical protein